MLKINWKTVLKYFLELPFNLISVLCPGKGTGYNLTFMENINLTIATFDEGNWKGNSSLPEIEVFKSSIILPTSCKNS